MHACPMEGILLMTTHHPVPAIRELTAWFKVLLLVLAWCTLSFHGSRAQPDNLGFISIDCGYTASASYPDGKTGMTFVADEGFTDAGLTHTVNMDNLQPDLALRCATVRFFPNGTRNCYTLRSLKPGGKYYLRATFGYGNYDRLNNPPTFDLYVGVNYWTTVRIVNASTAYVFDTIVMSSAADFLQVCLVRKEGSGNPFISGLDLRALEPNLYPETNATQSLVLLSFFRDDTVGFGINRYHFGTQYQHVRYPDDRYDRMWQRYQYVSTWTVPESAGGVVKNPPNDTYDAPSAVMMSASTPVNDSGTMKLGWSSDSSMDVEVDTNFLLLFFAEVQANIPVRNVSRQFDVIVDNVTLAAAFSPAYMFTKVITGRAQGPGPHNIWLVPTSSSNLPPLISGMEIYLVRPRNNSDTNPADATAMMTIKVKYSVARNWEGDPCSPEGFAWNGLNCAYYSDSSSPRITSLNLSSSGLVGEIDSSFGQLSVLQLLDLSHNNLSRPILDVLGQVPSLTFIDLSSNNLNGSIPTSLLQLQKSHQLILRVDNNPNLCVKQTCGPTTRDPKKAKERLLIIGLSAGTFLILALVVIAIWHIRRKRQGVTRAANPFENRRFKYKELKVITDDFRNVIGKGGFGLVYAGKLQDGTPVAVKMKSDSWKQGNAEFLAEARHLARVHHKNLVSLIGYCKNKKHLGLVYEFMDGGNLEDRLRGREASDVEAPLSWLGRLKIAVDSAYGLEYLHRSCRPPLIHRDVKIQNILLNSNLEAKISDFGLTRAFSSETKTHTSTRPAGTIGYLDPEYYTTNRLSEKSDVYSFGIVLLVLITGKSAIFDDGSSTDKVNIANWVRERLSEEAIECIADPRIRGDCDLTTMRKVAELAVQCTEQFGRDRPTMSEIVDKLTENLHLGTSSLSTHSGSVGTTSGSSTVADADPIGVLEIEEAR